MEALIRVRHAKWHGWGANVLEIRGTEPVYMKLGREKQRQEATARSEQVLRHVIRGRCAVLGQARRKRKTCPEGVSAFVYTLDNI